MRVQIVSQSASVCPPFTRFWPCRMPLTLSDLGPPAPPRRSPRRCSVASAGEACHLIRCRVWLLQDTRGYRANVDSMVRVGQGGTR